MVSSAWQQPSRFSNRQKTPQLKDLIPMKVLKSGVFYLFRFIAAPFTYAEHWIKIKTKKGEFSIRKLCLSYDHASGEFKGGCPYCDVCGDTPRVNTLQNVIDRKEQKRGIDPRTAPRPLKSETKLKYLPWDDTGEEQFYFKEKDSETWTPVAPIRLPSSAGQRVGDFAALNKKTDKKGVETVYPPEHVDYGFDFQIKYDENQSPANQYFISKEKRSPLTDEELDYPIHNLMVEKPEKLAAAQKEAENLAEKMAPAEDKEDSRGGKNERSGGKREARKYLEGMDENDDEDGDHRPGVNDNEDDPPPRGRGGRDRDEAPARGRSRDDAPPARGRTSRSTRDEEDEPPRGRASRRSEPNDNEDDDAPRARSRGRSRDDEDDLPPPRRGGGRESRRNDGLDM